MREQFEKYLIQQGYSQTTPSGHPSTVYDYQKRIDYVCKWEHTDWNGLAKMIDEIVAQYDVGGIKQEYGDKSHRAVINALKCFRDYLNLATRG